MVSLARVIGTAILVLLALGCGGGQDKGLNKDLDRPKSTDRGTKGTEKGAKAFRIQPDYRLCLGDEVS